MARQKLTEMNKSLCRFSSPSMHSALHDQ